MGNENSQEVKYGERIENDVKVVWRREMSDNPFPGRDGHCACTAGNRLYVFGGVILTNEDETVESNDLLIYDAENGSWTKAEVTGDIPGPRSSATISAVGDELYLFGGLSKEVGWFNQVYCYHTVKKVWKKLHTEGNGPSPRDKLASTVIGSNIYIFGGFGPQGFEEEEEVDDFSTEDEDEDLEALHGGQDGAQFGWFNDLHILDTVTKSWSSPMQMNLGVPTPRAAHAMCSVDKYLVIFGGRDSQARQNDLHIFDTQSRKWATDLVVHGRQPDPRSFHTATTVDRRVIITGGRGVKDQHFDDLHIFDTTTREWLQPAVEGDLPPGRGVHTVTVIGDKLLMYGGSSDLDPETMQCKTYYSDTFTSSTGDITAGNAVPADREEQENQENVPMKANVPSAKEEGLAAVNGTAMKFS